MRLHLKIILTIVPLVLTAILGLGLWSYNTARTNSFASLYRLLETTLNIQVIDELASRSKLLENSKMDKVAYFVDHYQQEALDAFKAGAGMIDGSHIFVFDHKGTFIFSSSGHKKTAMEPAWAAKALRVGSTGRINGHLELSPYNSFYSARYFSPWRWVVFLSVSDQALMESMQRIRKTTLLVAAAFAIITSLLLIVFFRVSIVRPVQRLQYAAARISRREPHTPIGMSTKDELGLLAKEVDVMASAITSYNTGQIRLQDDLRQSNASLKESEEKFRRAILMAPVPIMIHADDGEVIQINNSWTELTGYGHEDIPTIDDWTEKAYGIRKALVTGDINRLYDSEERVEEGEYEITTAGNAKIIWDFSSAPLGKQADGRRLAISMARDVTGSRRAAAEKARLEDKLRQAHKMEAIGTLAGGIAHDFNNILATILGYAEMAKDDAPSGSTIEEDLEEVMNAGFRAKELVKQILAFSRQAEKERIALRPAIIAKEAIKLLTSSIPATIEILQEIDPGGGMVLAAPIEIHQILMNLCTNAFHAMEETGGTLTITVKNAELDGKAFSHEPAMESGAYVMLSVRDTGPGIPPAIKDRIFDPYFTTKEIGKGTGMGLAITHGIVKSCGGIIQIDSKLGGGTAIDVYLPVAEGEVLPEAAAAEATPSGKERILFIDDDQLLAKMGKAMLERLGYAVTLRTGSIDALQAFQNQPDRFDLVLTDMTMPSMTGKDLARRMLQIRPDIPIILCTGYSAQIDEAKSRQIGIRAFAYKPLVKKDVARLIRKVLDGS